MVKVLFTEKQWIFRDTNKRLVTVKAKNADIRKIAVLDALTNLMFAVEVPLEMDFERLEIGNNYLFELKVFTSKNVDDVEGEFIDFFEAGDINQNIEDFIRAYWVHPTKIRFDLAEVEEA